MLLAVAAAVADEAVVRQCLRAARSARGDRGGMSLQNGLLERGEAETADAVWSAGETAVHDLVGQAEDLEDLAAAITRHGRDPHLREDLEEASLERRKKLGGSRLARRRQGQPRANRTRPVADEHRDVVVVTAVARLDH